MKNILSGSETCHLEEISDFPKIHLWRDSPLAFLNSAFPAGIPVDLAQLSLDEVDYYTLDPARLGDRQARRQMGELLIATDYSRFLIWGLAKYDRILIPEMWIAPHRPSFPSPTPSGMTPPPAVCVRCQNRRRIRSGFLSPSEGWTQTWKPCPACNAQGRQEIG